MSYCNNLNKFLITPFIVGVFILSATSAFSGTDGSCSSPPGKPYYDIHKMKSVCAPYLISHSYAPHVRYSGKAPFKKTCGEAPYLLKKGASPYVESCKPAPYIRQPGHAPYGSTGGYAPSILVECVAMPDLSLSGKCQKR